jgi:hypothetical protein
LSDNTLQEQTIIGEDLVWKDFKQPFFTVSYSKAGGFQSFGVENTSDLRRETVEKASLRARRNVAPLTRGARRAILRACRMAADNRKWAIYPAAI